MLSEERLVQVIRVCQEGNIYLQLLTSWFLSLRRNMIHNSQAEEQLLQGFSKESNCSFNQKALNELH